MPALRSRKQRSKILPESDSAGPAGLPPDKWAPLTEVHSSTHTAPLHHCCNGVIILVITVWVKCLEKCLQKVRMNECDADYEKLKKHTFFLVREQNKMNRNKLKASVFAIHD